MLLKKRQGDALSEAEIRHLVAAFMRGELPDYQMAAFLMAVHFQGMNEAETAALTQAIVESGDCLDLSSIPGPKVDKHSTGGVGDKTTLIVVPAVAACGVPVAKMSGRGLGHTGGTIDKLETFRGYRAEQTPAELVAMVRRVGAAISGQSPKLTPADKRLYALRDVTATVDVLPLIAASVVSKKIAAGSDAFVLDVKFGKGAFMADPGAAERLARLMVDIAQTAGRRAVALITAMDQPLGRTVGNALEVEEAIHTLQGQGPEDLVTLVRALGAEMLLLGGRASDSQEAVAQIDEALRSGRALKKFRDIVASHGGDTAAIDDPSRLERAPVVQPVVAPRAGYITAIDAHEVGLTALALGAGRAVKDADIDLSVGLRFHVKVGDRVEAGDLLCEVHARTDADGLRAAQRVQAAVGWGDREPAARPLILQRIASDTTS